MQKYVLTIPSDRVLWDNKDIFQIMNYFDGSDLQIAKGSHLLLIEGINGAGKSTYTCEFVRKNQYRTRICTYRGQGFHPVDLSRIARFSEMEYLSFRKMCMNAAEIDEKNILQSINVHTCYSEHYYWVDYTRIETICRCRQALVYAHEHELYDGFCSVTDFMESHLIRWKQFPTYVNSKSNDSIHLLEGVFFQYPIMNLLGFYDIDKMAIAAYMNSILSSVQSLSPCLVYLDVPDVEKSIKMASLERPLWMEQYCFWLKNTRYARVNGISGQEGVIAFCKQRQEIEHYILDKLSVPKKIIERHDLL